MNKKNKVGNQSGKGSAQQKPGRSARRKANKAARWSLGLGSLSAGPLGIKDFTISSRNVGNQGMVGLASRAVDIQREMPRLATSVNENGNTVDVLTGTDLLGTVTVPMDGGSEGTVLFRQPISPSLFANTRLAQFSDLYQRYRFRRVEFVYSPIANATQSGQVLGYADFDVDNPITEDKPSNLLDAAAHQGQAITQIWQPCSFNMGQVLTFTDLYTEAGGSESSDPRLSVQGMFYLLAASELQGNMALGNIYARYEIEFSIPFLSEKRFSTQLLSFSTTGNLWNNHVSGKLQLATFDPLFPPTTYENVGGMTASSGSSATASTLKLSGLRIGQLVNIRAMYNLTARTDWNTVGRNPATGYGWSFTVNSGGDQSQILADVPPANSTSATAGNVYVAGEGHFSVSFRSTATDADLTFQLAGVEWPNTSTILFVISATPVPVVSRLEAERRRVRALETEQKSLQQELERISSSFLLLSERLGLGSVLQVGSSTSPDKQKDRLESTPRGTRYGSGLSKEIASISELARASTSVSSPRSRASAEVRIPLRREKSHSGSDEDQVVDE